MDLWLWDRAKRCRRILALLVDEELASQIKPLGHLGDAKPPPQDLEAIDKSQAAD